MSNPNPSPDLPPSISAAELRRRLLASTPPPVAASAVSPEPATGEPASASQAWNVSQDLLSRLRMQPPKPGSAPVPVAAARSVVVTPPPGLSESVPDLPVRPITRRPQTPSRSAGYEPPPAASAISNALNALNGMGEGMSSRLPIDDSPMAEIQRLRSENRELRNLLEEMKHLLQEASEVEQQFTAKEAEYNAALQEKKAQIDELSAQLGTIEEQIAKGELAPPPPVPKTRTELEEWNDELEKESARLTQERKRLDDERRQLRDDEEGLERQMREMEVSMARERAMLARQETELKRLSAEIQHELDMLQRGDTGLREQMAKFQRRAQEVLAKPTPGGAGARR